MESYSSDDNPVEYASGRMSETASRILHKSSDGAATAGRQGAKATKNVLKKIVISLARAARAAGEAIKASAAAIAAAGMCCGFFVLSPLRCKRHKNTLDGAKGYKNKSSPEGPLLNGIYGISFVYCLNQFYTTKQ